MQVLDVLYMLDLHIMAEDFLTDGREGIHARCKYNGENGALLFLIGCTPIAPYSLMYVILLFGLLPHWRRRSYEWSLVLLQWELFAAQFSR